MSAHISYAAAPQRDSFELQALSPGDTVSGASSPADLESPRSSAEPGQTSRPRQYRSYSVSSAFDFNSHLVPLTSTADTRYQPLGAPSSAAPAAAVGSLEKQKTLTFLNGLSLLIGLQIGSGIFSSPSQVNNHVPSPGLSLIVWAIAGLLAWTGAASYAELGGAIPLNGGSGVYLRHCFGELAGFLFSWTAVIVLKPGSSAIIAIIAGEYINRVIFGSFGAEHDSPLPGIWANKITAVVCFLVVTALNIISTKLTTRLSDGMMFLKVSTLLAITIVGIVVAATGLNGDGTGANTEWKEMNWFTPRPGGIPVREQEHDPAGELGEYAIALYAGLWAFDGWDNVNYVTGEMRHASRDLPRVIHTAMPTVIISYLLANMSYYFVLSGQVIGSSNTVAVAFGTKVFGNIGGLIFAIFVSISCFGALNASTFTSGRLVYSAGKEGYLPSIFATLGFSGASTIPRIRDFSEPTRLQKVLNFVGLQSLDMSEMTPPWQKTPVYAMLLNSALTLCYILVGEFGTLLTFYGVAGYTFYFTTVLGLIILRVREPALERPYKTWITTPIVFCCVSLFLILRSVFSHPLQTLLVAAFVAAGCPVYYIRVKGWRGWRKG